MITQKARLNLTLTRQNIRKQQNLVLRRYAGLLGLRVDDEYINTIQGQVHPSFNKDYDSGTTFR